MCGYPVALNLADVVPLASPVPAASWPRGRALYTTDPIVRNDAPYTLLADTRRTVRRRLRVVAVRLPESTEYRCYLTNIGPNSLDAHAVAQTYAARWQIELIFKELKSHYRLDELPTRKAHIVETLLLGAVITLLVSRRLLQAVRERLRRTPYKMPEQRWAAIFAAAAPAILDIVRLPPRVSKVIARRLESMLLHEAPDPNRSRRLLIERVESGAAWA